MKIKSTLSKVGNGLLTATTVVHNTTIQTKIDELDKQIEELQERRAELEKELIEYR